MKNLKCTLIINFLIVVLLLMSACNVERTLSAPERICENLIAEGLIEQAQCFTDDKQQTIYIPFYFPVRKVTFEYVSIGMKGFELLSLAKSNNCEGGGELIVAHYLTGTTDNVYFAFCNNELVNITYDD